MSGGRKRAFCSPVPATTIGIGPKMLRWTAEAALIAPAESVSACIITAASASPSPLPPCSAGIAMPSQPPSATARRYSCGNAPSRSRASQYSSLKRAVTRRTPSSIARWSSVSAKSMAARVLFQRRERLPAASGCRSRLGPNRVLLFAPEAAQSPRDARESIETG